MIFTSYTYLLFLAVAFLVHWTIPTRWRNPFLIAASYLFYCTWRWEYGFLLLGLSLFNWAYGRWILPKASETGPLLAGVAVNVGVLVYFKYTGFVASNTASLLSLFGVAWQPGTGSIILPLGISFFTFQGVAYLIDVASGDEPLESLERFLLFKAFWPQLIAGPIVRLHEFRAQLETPRVLDYANVAAGSQRILQGYFKKIVLADNLATHVDMVFMPGAAPNCIDSVAGIVAFGMQIYFDFSAYSDIALGSAKLFGFELPENFDWPYRARSPQEFWNRWHQSLTRWIRDYVFTPLSLATRARPALGPLWLLLSMALCGLWHGPKWTFVAWGVWHGLLLALNYTPLKVLFAPDARAASASKLRAISGWALTFVLVNAGWLLFRAESLKHAASIAGSVFALRGGIRPSVLRETAIAFVLFVVFATLVAPFCFNFFEYKSIGDARRAEPFWVRVGKPVLYSAMIIAVICLDQEAKAFVYFQF